MKRNGEWAVMLCLLLGIVGCSPSKPTTASTSMNGLSTELAAKYTKSCVICHENTSFPAPQSHDLAAWQPRLAKGLPTLIQHTQQGFNQMPAKGMCGDCTTADYDALIRYMSTARPTGPG